MDRARHAELSFIGTLALALLALFALLLVGLWLGVAVTIVAALVACATAYVAQLANTFSILADDRDVERHWMIGAWFAWGVSLAAWLAGLLGLFL